MDEKKLSFEESMKRLEEIVTHLEKGDISLQESLTLFEEGSSLLKDCSRMLDEAEQKVVQLRKSTNREPEEYPYE
ncbi:MAG: exodeoxyribonuclease VII small subunit [Oscillospiraceae bacterium]|nr:exodeoxyribonuclease VII small subunit [Oscillospiraceae bacterium]